MGKAGYTDYKLVVDGKTEAEGRMEDMEPEELLQGNNWIGALRELGQKANAAILEIVDEKEGRYITHHPATDLYLLDDDHEKIDALIKLETLGGVGIGEGIGVKIVRL